MQHLLFRFYLETIPAKPNVNHESQSCLGNQGHIQVVIMQCRVASYSPSIYLYLLQSCIAKKALADGKLIHAHICKMGSQTPIIVQNTLVNMYVNCGTLAEARRAFDRMTDRDVHSWTVIISAYVRQRALKEALMLFQRMQGTGVQPNHFTFASVLPACESLKQVMEIHEKVIINGVLSDIVVVNALIDTYAKWGGVRNASELFDKMPQRDVVSWTAMVAGYSHNCLVDKALVIFKQMPWRNMVAWNAMIAGFSQNGFCEEALDLFQQMQLAGVNPGCKTFASILPACANLVALEKGMEIHGKIVVSGFDSNVLLVNALIDMYAKCGIMFQACKLFERSPHLDVVSWNVMIAGYAQKGLVNEALVMFNKMPQRDAVSWNTMISGFVQNGFVDEAMKLFNEMGYKTAISWNIIIAGLGQNGYSEEVLELFQQMQLAGAAPDSRTFASTLSACAQLAAVEQGLEIHGKLITDGFQSDVMLLNSLIDMYAKCGNLQKACDIFDKIYCRDVVSWNVMIAGYSQNGLVDKALHLFMQMPQRNLVSWNTIISGLAQNKLGEEALKCFQQMHLQGVKPDSKTLASILPLCAKLAAMDLGMEIHEKAIVNGLLSDIFVTTALLDMYAQCGCMEHSWKLFKSIHQGDPISWNAMITGNANNGLLDVALKLFNEMPLRNTDSWNAMIAGFAHNGHYEKALKLFWQMQVEGKRPDPKTFTTILPVCANIASVEQGTRIHQEIIRSRFSIDVIVMNALIDMYAKCGNIQKARKLFYGLHRRDLVSWNIMIGGYAIYGCGKEAIDLFEQLKVFGVHPNHVTFLHILSACNHAGLVDEGYQHFHCMYEYYNIKPAMEHYICMVDLLGRAGHLAKAQDFINKMPIKPDIAVWSCLLGACRMHNNVDLGEFVAKHLFELNPKNTAPYVLLSNIYAVAGRWDEIEKVRKLMKDRGVKKTPGCSWIEIDKEMHTFVAGDRLLKILQS
ncbi:pentatricopeptide repeat-containing protein At2g13600 [Cryptomeria japonica]|uniref:pentatricopeptide repeat-containing protein At2g13600 n=1 Tax=Cryptomeria japonica TaxID=3369 RepID=UPI0027DA5AE1|nr:pentatricopeptide repeat-containing protein At2g13600 [Cryptomeria japonica]